MIEINQLLKKYRTGNYSEQELNDLIEVLKSPVHDDAVEVLMNLHWEDDCKNTAIGDEERFNHILSEIHHNINLKSTKVIKPSWSKRLYVGLSRVAAIIVIPLIIALIVSITRQQSNLVVLQNTVSVPFGATSEFDLPDGTHIWLNAGSKLTYPLSFVNQPNRVVVLNGEGFFKVKKDQKCPFVVKMNGMDVKVTGTTFNARAYSDEPNVTVALVEGSVLLGKQSSGNNFEKTSALSPMEVAVLNKTSKQFTLTQKTDLTKYTAWTQGITVFDNDPILDVTAKLEKLYNVHVVIPDNELLQYRLTATFENEPLERALKIISLSSPVDYNIIAGKQNANGTYGQRTLILKSSKKMK